MGRSPLGEEMGHFEKAHPAAVGHPYPAIEAAEVEGVVVSILFDLHQLHRGPFATDPCVQRQCKERCQQQVDPVIDGTMYELFESLPMSRTPDGIAVLSSDAIGLNQLL